MCDRLLSLQRMARRLGITQAWLKDEADADRVPHLKAGRVFLFEPEALERTLVERARGVDREVIAP